ncbi:MAG: DUF1223 domain-containing protein [Hyphomicrobium sp.]|uniref:DUF1223 domain-containing protein n=1 Tax=Hyphomicrobium sp. TaxID=82 RepID=UPI00132C9434|nr:DUF1223 domain-containing protein [Hyphomicrobium sp.]KAB2941175.1 MAG: DUF1223 domain-containing protein [Hyphomicrobium sp.]MBZ0208436.1 DUF1223 domain-containing protein [Hyphomicrobium sp.]
MRRNTFVLALAVLTVLTGATQAKPRAVVVAKPRAVVELFTSPFCSSCPPADALFVELARHPDLITLVMPVDSWDRPGRKDALAKPAFTERQSAYADVRNEDFLYTPQAVINGAAQAEGSDIAEIGDAVAQTAGVLSVPVKAMPVGEEIVVSVGAAKGAASSGAMITVLPFVASREIPMRGGETLRYANLVRDIVPVGRWDGKPVKQKLPLNDYAQYDGIVVLLQAGTPERPGAILGATRLPIRPKLSALRPRQQ